MKFERWLSTIDAHTEGMAVRLITAGIPNIPGKTMAEKRDFFSQNLDHFRTALCDEPRGHESMFVVMMTPPVTEEASFGVFFMSSPKRYSAMCGHASIGVAIIAVEMGLVELKEPVTEVIFDTPAGTIHAGVSVENGKAKSATIQNVPAFHYTTTLIKVPGLGELPVDIAFGGDFYAFVKARDIGVKTNPDDLARAADLLKQIWESVNQQVETKHPEQDFNRGVGGIVINDEPRNPKASILNISIRSNGKMRSREPCGTCTSAKMATLWTRGELGLGETYVTESIIGTLYYGKLTKEVRVGNFRAAIPEITGRTFITGIHNFFLDEDDPFKYGFRL